MMDQWIDHSKKIIYTIGYEGLKVDNFIYILKSFKIERLIDVRRNAYSRNPFYISKNLNDVLLENNIQYLHTPEIAPTEQIRLKYRESGIWNDYAIDYNKFLNENMETFNKWVLLLRKNDCLMCMEKNPKYCHRSLLGERLKPNCIIVNIKREGREKA